MVIEAKSIKGSLKGLQYQADDKEQAVEILRNGLFGDQPKKWHEQMRNLENENTRIINKRISVILAPSKEVSKTLTHEDWKNMVNSYLDKMGIDKSNHIFIAHLHNSTDDKHCHLIISRIPMNIGNKNGINDNQIGIKAGKIADKIAKENGWRTATEISKAKKESIGKALRIVLKTTPNFTALEKAMKTHGFLVQLSQNEAKGIYGMRIIPIEDININPSQRAQNSKQGYKLSEIERHEGRKAKFRIADVKMLLERNAFKIMSPQEKIEFIQSKNDKIFGDSENNKSTNDSINHQMGKTENSTSTNIKTSEKSILDVLLKPSYTESSSDDITKKKRKKKR